MPNERSGEQKSRDPSGDSPEYRSHYRPRTRDGWIAVVLFLTLFAGVLLALIWKVQP